MKTPRLCTLSKFDIETIAKVRIAVTKVLADHDLIARYATITVIEANAVVKDVIDGRNRVLKTDAQRLAVSHLLRQMTPGVLSAFGHH